jgi:hypothetical protein
LGVDLSADILQIFAKLSNSPRVALISGKFLRRHAKVRGSAHKENVGDSADEKRAESISDLVGDKQ